MRKTTWVLLAVLAIAGSAPALAAGDETKEEPRTELQKMHRALDQMSRQVMNAEARLRNGAVSVGSDAKEGDELPARQCCGKNIDTITKELENVARSIQTLRDCYRAKENAEAEVELNFVFEDAASLFRALGNFTNAKRKELMMGHGAVVKAVLLLKKSAAKLPECETP